MAETYPVVLKPGFAETEEKKSRFLTAVLPVHSEEEVQSLVEAYKKKYYDASHNCTAFTLGNHHELTRANDDGEPSKTAGRPMLDVLLAEEVHNTLVIVTRYFGGTLLGTGGLVKAYQTAVKEGLRNAVIALKKCGIPLTVSTDYKMVGKILFLSQNKNIIITGKDYSETVTLSFLPEKEQLHGFLKEITDVTSAKADIQSADPVWFCVNDGNIHYFSD